ncbi:DUF4349 domain-containing protein [Micromonospora sonneratiae]|uniref:DUF4349 domain-containing protein n=1 Tax=Micromonospora sonneratiae TaxID=1184706 RepID=A0ABW3YLN3_9ACTN
MAGMRQRRFSTIFGAVALTTVLATAGCGSSSDRNTAGSSRADGGAAVEKQDAPVAAEAKPGQPDTAAKADLRIDQRSIIYSGTITVRVDSVDEVAARATAIATTAGGFVGADERTSSATSSRAKLELRVPATKFGAVVDEVAGLGRQERRSIDTQDVTEETLDLDARIATQQARVESGRRLLAQAKSLSDLVMLEAELAKREADLASLEAKKRRLADLTALSTITVTLLGPDAKGSEEEEPQTGFVAGLKGGWKAFLASLEVLLTVLGALLPWIIALGVPVFGVIWLVRRLGRRARPAATAVAVPRQAPPTAAMKQPVSATRPAQPAAAPDGPTQPTSSTDGPTQPASSTD